MKSFQNRWDDKIEFRGDHIKVGDYRVVEKIPKYRKVVGQIRGQLVRPRRQVLLTQSGYKYTHHVYTSTNELLSGYNTYLRAFIIFDRVI